MISYTSDNEFFRGKVESFPVIRFLLELTQHIPPRGSKYIQRYELNARQRRWYGTSAVRTKEQHRGPQPGPKYSGVGGRSLFRTAMYLGRIDG